MSSPLILAHTPESFRAGSISRRVAQWEKVTRDPWILAMVRGVEIPLVQEVTQDRPPFPFRLSPEEKLILRGELVKLQDKGVIQKTYFEEGQFLSNVFLRPKANGEFRLILDLTEFNKKVEYDHFKMTSLQTAIEALRPGAWMGSVDLRDAYYSVAIEPSNRKFLKFTWEGECFEFRALPNGLSCAPRIFTKLMKPLFASLAERGHECFPYIDVSFVIADEEDCQGALDALCQGLDDLGFVVHMKKSVLEPTQRIIFLGFWLDSRDMTITLTQEKKLKFTRAASDLLEKENPTIREVAGLVGLMTAYSPAVEYGGSHIKRLELDKNRALAIERGIFDARMHISQGAREDISWWLENLEGARLVRTSTPDVEIATDASMEGWGAYRGSQTAGGHWSEREKEEHINVLEMIAIYFGLKSLCSDQGMHVQVYTDNTTALAYVKHMGGVKSRTCNFWARVIWDWCEERDIWLSIAHLPGVLNVVADYKSRHFVDNTEWQLNDKIWNKICKIFGTPEVDLFASRLNAKLEKFVVWGPDPEAYRIDAFTFDWNEGFYYIFPPFTNFFVDNTEWQLNDKIWNKICKIFGTPEVDLFASRLNAKLENFVVWGPDPEAYRIDAFTFDWNEGFYYIFPPFSLIDRVVQKLHADGAKAILVVPSWPTQPWYARVQRNTTRKLRFRANGTTSSTQGGRQTEGQ